MYADIVALTVPSNAAPGALVSIEVRIKNLGNIGRWMTVTGRYIGAGIDKTLIKWQPELAVIRPGGIRSFTISFAMPNTAIAVHVWSWYWDGTQWQVVGKGDDHAYKSISLAADTNGGVVIRKDRTEYRIGTGPSLPFDEAKPPEVPPATTFAFLPRFTNRGTVTRSVTLSATVTDPQGRSVAIKWFLDPTHPITVPPGRTGGIGFWFTTEVPGNYTVKYDVFADGLLSDSWTVVMCRVTVPATGALIRSQIVDVTTGRHYNSQRDPFPVSIRYGNKVRVIVHGQNTSAERVHMRLTVNLVNPDNIIKATRSYDASVPPGGDIVSGWTTEHALDMSGLWKIIGELEEV